MEDKDFEILCGVLLHQAKTRTFLKRLKKEQPNNWQRVYGNIRMAYDLLAPKRVTRTQFQIGVFDPKLDGCWPWHSHYEHGIYLSSNQRLCKWKKAARFDSPETAREFFHEWSGKGDLKIEIIPIETTQWLEPHEL